MLTPEVVKDIVERLHRISRNPIRYATRWYENPENRRRQFETSNRYHHKKRALKAKSGGSHTREEWQQRKELYGYSCVYCHRKSERLTKDHIIPISRGGTDNIYNIVPACGSCNRRKWSKNLNEWEEFTGLQLPLNMN